MLDTETIAYGITYSLLSAIILPFYLVLTYVMMTDAAIKKMVSNRLVGQLNVADCIQLSLHFISGFLVLFPNYAKKYPNVVRIMGAVINASWLVTFPILCLLAFTRMLIIQRYVSAYKTNFGLKLVNAVGLLMGASVLVFGLVGKHFTFTDVHWEYDVEKPFTDLVRSMELYAFTPCIFLSYLAYVGMTFRIRMTRNMAENSYAPRFENQIFLHYFIVCTFIISLVIWWNVSAIFALSSRVQDFIMNCCWIIACGVNPIAVMLFNRTARVAVLKFFGLQKHSSISAVNTSISVHPRDRSTS